MFSSVYTLTSPSLSCAVDLRGRWPGEISWEQSRGAESPLLSCCPRCFWCFPGCAWLSGLRAHYWFTSQLFTHKNPQVLLHSAALRDLFSQSLLMYAIVLIQVQNIAVIESHEVLMNPLPKIFQPFPGWNPFCCVKFIAQLPVISKLAECALDLTVSLIKILKSNSPKTRALRNITHHQPPPGHRAIDHNSLPLSTQTIPYPLHSSPFQPLCLQFGCLVSHVQPPVNQHPQVFPLGSFPTTPHPACIPTWGCFDPSARPSIWPCWTSYNWPWTISPVYEDPSSETSYSPADKHSHPIKCHLKTDWGSTWSPHPGHW